MRRAVLFLSLLGGLLGIAACGFSPDVESDVLTIEFDTNGGTALESVDVDVGDTLTLPVPEQEGHTFDGWYVLEDLSGQSITEFPAVTGGTLTLYAGWVQSTFTLTFDSMGGSAVEPLVLNEGDTLNTPAAPTLEGYEFLGWYADDTFSEHFDFETFPVSDMTLYALFEGVESTLTFNVHGGSSVNAITDHYGNTIEAPAPPTKPGYGFDGWYEDDTFDTEYTFSTMPLGDMTLHAAWRPALVDVTVHRYIEDLDQEGYTLFETVTDEAYTESTYEIETKDIPGFTADETHDDNVTSGTVLPDGSLELTLHYGRDTITMTYESNADFSIASSSGLFESPASEPEDPERLGYIFEGWYTDDTLSTPYTFNAFPHEDITIYAGWEGTPSTIHFNPHGGSEIDSLTENNGEPITLETPARDGYDFIGWYLSDAYLTEFTETIMPVGGATLHARWRETTYTLSFETGDGTDLDDMDLTFEERITLPDDPVLDGHVFAGWFMEADHTTPFSLTTMPARDTTLHAKWIVSTNPNSVINQVTKDEGSDVEIHGVVHATFTSAYKGFMIFDETGQVFIDHSHADLEIGDAVEVTGVLEFEADIPYVRGVTGVTTVSSSNPTKTPSAMDFDTLSGLPPTPHYIHNVYTTTGLLYEESDDYYLVDLSDMDLGLTVHYKSYLPDALPLIDDAVFNRVEMTYALLHTDDGLALAMVSLEKDPFTDDEILALIQAYVTETLGEATAFPGDILEIPSTDPLGLTTISFEAVGDNASHFDAATHEFGETTEERIVEFEITIQVIGSTEAGTFNFDVTLKPITLSTIDELLASEEGSFHRLEAVVVAQSDEGQVALKDATGTLFLETLNGVEIGDEVDVTVRRDIRHGAVYPRHEDGGIILNAILSGENEIGHEPLLLDTADVLALDVSDPTIYGDYVEIRGFLVDDPSHMDHNQYLATDDYTLTVSTFTYNGFEKLFDYQYLEVIMRGFLFTTEDGELSIVYEGIRRDIRIPEYSDEERIDVIEQMLFHMYAGREYYGHEYFETVPYHPVLGSDIAWSMDVTTASVYDDKTSRFMPVTEDTPLAFTITITEGTQSRTLTFNATLKAVEVTPVRTLHTPDLYGMHYVEGTLVYWHPELAVLMDDEGDTVRLDMDLPYLRTGDRVILYAQWQKDGDGPVYLSDPYDVDGVVKLLSRENPFTITHASYSIGDVLAEDPHAPTSYNRFIEVTGLLEKTAGYHMNLMSPEGIIRIEFPDTYTQRDLERFERENATLRGYLDSYDWRGGVWTMKFLGLTGDLSIIPYSDQEAFDLIETFIIDTYDVTLEGDQSVDFEAVDALYGDATVVFTPQGGDAALVDVDGGWVYPVEEATMVQIEVALTVGEVHETFTVTMTLTPEEEVTIDTIETMQNDLGTTYTFRARVLTVVYVGSEGYVLVLEDDSGVVFLTLTYNDYYGLRDYNGYIGEIVEVRGYAVADRGRYWVEHESFNIHSRSHGVTATFVPKTLAEINELNLYDPSVYGQPVNITGTVVREDLAHVAKFYIESGHERVLISNYETWTPMIDDYTGYTVTLDGFIYGPNANYETDDITLSLYNHTYDGETPLKLSGYSDEAIVELTLGKLVDNFNEVNPKRDPYDYVWFPVIPNAIRNHHSGISSTYTLLENGDYLQYEGYHYRTLLAPEDKTIEVEITVSYGGHALSDIVLIELNGFEIEPLSNLFADTPGTFEIALEGQLIMNDFGFMYMLIDEQVYYHESYAYTWAGQGDTLIIVGKKNVIDGVPDYTYDISFIPTDYATLNLIPTLTSIETLYTHDHDTDPMRFDYWSVVGTLGYDPYLEMFTLEDDYGLIYIRSNDTSYEGTGIYFDYIGEIVEIDILLPMKTIRDEYILVDSLGGHSDISMTPMNEQEALDATVGRLGEMDPIVIQSGDSLHELPYGFYHYDTNVEYSLIDPDDSAYIDTDLWVAGNVGAPTDVMIRATVTRYGGTFEETVDLTVQIHPRTTSPIKEALFTEEEATYQVEGVVIAASPLGSDDAWMLIEDDSGRIFVNLNSSYRSLFNHDGTVYAVGDEVLIIADYGHFDSHGVVPVLTDVRVIEILSSDNTFTHEPIDVAFEDILALDYLYPETFYHYVEITGTLDVNWGMVALNQDGYYSETYSTDYPLYLKGQETSFLSDMTALEGETVTVRGYLLGFDYLYTDFDWHMAYVSHEVITASP